MIAWLAARPLFAAIAGGVALVVPGFVAVERQIAEVDEPDQAIVTAVEQYCASHDACDGVTPAEIARAVTAYCAAHDECRGPRGPRGPRGLLGPGATPPPGTTSTTVVIDGLERQEAEIQEREVQEREEQEAEIQEAPIPGPAGPVGPPGPACPTGYRLREVRIPSVSNTAIFLVCARG